MSPLQILAYSGALLFGTIILAMVAMIVAVVAIKIRDEWNNKGDK